MAPERFAVPLLVVLAAALGAPASAVAACPAVGCGIVRLPHALTFSDDRGGLQDGRGAGTGFTMVDQPSRGAGLLPERLRLDRTAGRLLIDTTTGLAFRDVDSLDNALGVGLDTGGGGFWLATTLRELPPVVDGYAQAGLWMGASEDDYLKLIVLAGGGSQRVQILGESGGRVVQHKSRPLPVGADVQLRLRVDTATARATGAYTIDGGRAHQVGSVHVPVSSLYRWTAAGRRISTGGIFASHRLWHTSLRYAFDDFWAACLLEGCAPGPAPENPHFGDVATEPAPGNPARPREPATMPVLSPTRPGASPRAMAVKVKVPRRIRYATLVRRGLLARVDCGGACRSRARLLVSARAARSLGLRARGPAASLALARGTAGAFDQSRVVVRPPAGVGRRLRRARTPVGATLEVQAVFPSGYVAITRRIVRLVR